MKNKTILIAGSVVTLFIVAAVSYLVYLRSGQRGILTPSAVITSFEQCQAAGYPVLQSYPRRCSTPTGETFTENPAVQPTAEAPVIIPGTGSKLYDDVNFGFRIWYPEGSDLNGAAFGGYLSATRQGAVGIYLSPDLFKGTNLGEAGVFIGVDASAEAVANCDRTAGPQEKDNGTTEIGGQQFRVFDSVGVGAGNLYEERVYRAVRRGSCYEVVELLHSGNIQNFMPGTVTEFDKARFSGILDTMARTFEFTPSPASGIEGRVTLGPTCPVERIPPDPRCAPKPYQTDVTITGPASFSRDLATDPDGNFRIGLEPGTYQLQARGGQVLPRCSPMTVEVKQGEFAPVTVTCDSGIR